MLWKLEFLPLQEQSFTSWFFMKRSWILIVLPAFVSLCLPLPAAENHFSQTTDTHETEPSQPSCLTPLSQKLMLWSWHQTTRYATHNDIYSRAKFSLSITLSCFVSVQTLHLKYNLLLVHRLPGDCFLGTALFGYSVPISPFEVPPAAKQQCTHISTESPRPYHHYQETVLFWTCCTAVTESTPENSP